MPRLPSFANVEAKAMPTSLNYSMIDCTKPCMQLGREQFATGTELLVKCSRAHPAFERQCWLLKREVPEIPAPRDTIFKGLEGVEDGR